MHTKSIQTQPYAQRAFRFLRLLTRQRMPRRDYNPTGISEAFGWMVAGIFGTLAILMMMSL